MYDRFIGVEVEREDGRMDVIIKVFSVYIVIGNMSDCENIEGKFRVYCGLVG